MNKADLLVLNEPIIPVVPSRGTPIEGVYLNRVDIHTEQGTVIMHLLRDSDGALRLWRVNGSKWSLITPGQRVRVTAVAADRPFVVEVMIDGEGEGEWVKPGPGGWNLDPEWRALRRSHPELSDERVTKLFLAENEEGTR